MFFMRATSPVVFKQSFAYGNQTFFSLIIEIYSLNDIHMFFNLQHFLNKFNAMNHMMCPDLREIEAPKPDNLDALS